MTETHSQKGFWRHTNKPDAKSHCSRALHSLTCLPLKSSYSLSVLCSAEIGMCHLPRGQLLARFVLPGWGMQPQDHSACPGMPTVLAQPPQNSARQPDGQEVGRRKNTSCAWRGLFRAASATPSDKEHNPGSWAAVAAALWLGSRRGRRLCQVQGAS